jgi:subtilisin family serine protease
MRSRCIPLLLVALTAGCGASAPPPATRPTPASSPAPTAPPPASQPPPTTTGVATRLPILPPARALLVGLMPLHSAGVDDFRAKHPTYDGRGVLIGILDTGVDPGVDGLIVTSTGAPKMLDVRDFSGEGVVRLTPVTPTGDGTVSIAGRALSGAGRIGRLTTATTWYAGTLAERPLGKVPGADLNGDGTNGDAFPVIVAKATDGWVAFIDTNLDGSFEDEMPLHDYRQGREVIALGTKPITLAVNFGEVSGVPTLAFVFDNNAHGTHVAGIAAGHNLFDVAGFDGVAPGAQLLGLKIANDARGGISMTGSIQHAMEYAARFAEQRNLPLVLNLSWGIGNEPGERAVIDSIVDAFIIAHPGIVFAISAGNDGPGLSTVGLPGSADLAVSVGAALPGIYVPLEEDGAPPVAGDFVGSFSGRGGRFGKPDVLAPGWAFSTVPSFDTGNEIKAGTSMSAPYVAGLAACLMSALVQEGRTPGGAEVSTALRAGAAGLPGASVVDQGAGVPQLERAYRWLLAGHQGSGYVVRATTGGGSAAFRRDGLAGPADTVETFRARHVTGLRVAQFSLKSDAPWLTAPAMLSAGSRETEIPLTYDAAALAAPGVYVGTVTAWNPSDALAGPLFRLVNVVAVPYDLADKPLSDERRMVGPAQVRRYFLRVAQPGATLVATVTLADSGQQTAKVILYEPNGAPFRELARDSIVPIGGSQVGTARFAVRGEDAVAGVYELDVVAPPRSGAVATVRAQLAPLTLADREATNPGQAIVSGRVTQVLLGAERALDVAGRGATPESLTVSVPDWAATAVVEVEVPREQWREFTDFGVTEFDSAGQQVSQGPLEFAFGRQAFAVPTALHGRPLTVELYPGFARDKGVHPWRATVRVRFLLSEPRPLGDGRDITVLPGGRAPLPAQRPRELALPEGFAPLVELRVRSSVGAPDAARRVVVNP